MKKYDIYFAVVVFVIAAVVTMFYGVLGSQESSQVTVTVNHKKYGIYLLSANQEIEINDTNRLKIENGKAYMKSATCPNQDCVHQKEISKKGEAITCLPNKVVVEVTSGESSELDGVAN